MTIGENNNKMESQIERSKQKKWDREEADKRGVLMGGKKNGDFVI